MKLQAARSLAVCALVAFGCGKKGSANQNPAPGDGGAGSGGSLPAPAPLSVTPHPDPAATKSDNIGPAGGNIDLAGSDGSTYTLTVPKDALLGDETITLTALGSVDGLPFSGGFLAGVDVAPEGLRLLKPATLAITPAATPPSGEAAIGFGSRADGSEFHLAPVASSGGAQTLSLWHFSAHGVGAGTAADVSAQEQQHPPTALDDWLAQERAGNPDANALHNQLQEEGQALQTAAAGITDEQALVTEASIFAAWEAAGGSSDPALAPLDQGIGAALAQSVEIVATTEMANCLATPDLKYAVRLLQLAGWAQANLSRWSGASAVDAQVSRCARFELDIDSNATIENTSSIALVTELRGSVKDIVSAAPAPVLAFQGSGPLTHASVTFDVPQPCSGSADGADGSAGVAAIDVPVDLGSAALLAPVLADVAVSLDLHSDPPTETIHYQCGGRSETFPGSLWLGLFTYFHQGLRQADGTFRLAGWTPGGAPGVIGTLTFDNQSDAIGTEHTVFTLRLTPG